MVERLSNELATGDWRDRIVMRSPELSDWLVDWTQSLSSEINQDDKKRELRLTEEDQLGSRKCIEWI